MSDSKNKKFFDNYNVPKGSKIDNFDFYEFSEHLTNSITDKLYRSYLPPLERVYRAKQEMEQDDDLTNDFDVDHIVDTIKNNWKRILLQMLQRLSSLVLPVNWMNNTTQNPKFRGVFG